MQVSTQFAYDELDTATRWFDDGGEKGTDATHGSTMVHTAVLADGEAVR